MTSHEIRNPLSAILHCAEDIASSLSEYRKHSLVRSTSRGLGNGHLVAPNESSPNLVDLLDSAIESAETISYCGRHQKRIVDDILTLSRLDSSLLQISPAAVEPTELIKKALRMFEAELKTADVQLKFERDPSLQGLSVDWVLLDAGRVLQVLVNLITNAIKFTRTEAKRHITVTLAAASNRPSEVCTDIDYCSLEREPETGTSGVEWGDGEIVYLLITVQDTGRGLTNEEKRLLFNRFAQASPKTYVQYGGSGLGLFISRKITEMHGGQIGLASEAGVGSTFRFFIKTRRTRRPEEAILKSTFKSAMRIAEEVEGACGYTAPSVQDEEFSLNSQSNRPHAPVTHSAPSVVFNPPMAVLHILVVEDNLINQRVLARQLRNRGCAVYVANHGGEALDFLQETTFWNGNCGSGKQRDKELSVILLDQEMPVMDGLTCIRKIRQLQSEGTLNGHVPVIAVTANAREGHIKTAMEAGMVSSVQYSSLS